MFCGIYNGIHLHILLYVLCVGLRCVRSSPSDRSPPPSPLPSSLSLPRPSALPIRRARRTATGCGRAGRDRDVVLAAAQQHGISATVCRRRRRIATSSWQRRSRTGAPALHRRGLAVGAGTQFRQRCSRWGLHVHSVCWDRDIVSPAVQQSRASPLACRHRGSVAIGTLPSQRCNRLG